MALFSCFICLQLIIFTPIFIKDGGNYWGLIYFIPGKEIIKTTGFLYCLHVDQFIKVRI